jgi:hypothetical protein
MLRYALIGLLLAATAAIATAQSQKGPNGGTIVKSHGHPIEFVQKGQELVFYIGDDDGSPLPTKTMRGRATVQDAGKTTTVTLAPGEPNLMTGKAQAPLGAKARIVFSGTLHGHTLTARYVAE